MTSVVDKDLLHLYPAFRTKAVVLVSRLQARGLDVAIYEGYRSLRRAVDLFSIGRPLPWEPGSSTIKPVTKAFPGRSPHNYGLAVDIVFNASKNFLNGWDDSHPWPVIGEEALLLGLEWGGKWKFVDRPHVQYTPFNLPLLEHYYEQGGLSAVWQFLDKQGEKK